MGYMIQKKIIIGNWKLNPTTPREAKDLFVKVKTKAVKIKTVTTVMCPPVTFMSLWSNIRPSKVCALGAQDCFSEASGAFTGQVSPEMLKNLNTQYVLVGHSERRVAGDDDELINKKIKGALKFGLTVVLCVGETVRDDHGVYLETIKEQLLVGLNKIPKASFDKIIIAYEPVWAIGDKASGVDSPEAFLAQQIYIRKVLAQLVGTKEAMKIPVLYGGSVNSKNAASFLDLGEADGLLVGRASLRADLFTEIINIAEYVSKKSKK